MMSPAVCAWDWSHVGDGAVVIGGVDGGGLYTIMSAELFSGVLWQAVVQYTRPSRAKYNERSVVYTTKM